MAVNLSPVAGAAAQFFDNSGNVLTGGKLYTYDAGTTTPAPTYTNSTGVTAQPNPIILNAAGRVPDSGEIWLADSVSYKFVLKDANDVLIGTYDNLVGINSNFVNFTGEEEQQTAIQGQTIFTLTTLNYQPSTNNLLVFVNGSKQISGTNYQETSSTVITFVDGLNVGDVVNFCTATPINTNAASAASVTFTGFKGQIGNVQNLADDDGSDWVGFLPPGTNAVARSAQDKMRDFVTSKDFGAIGDGVADDTVECQNWLDYLESTGGEAYWVKGSYLVNNLTLAYTGAKDIKMSGDGPESVQLISNQAGVPALYVDGNTGTSFSTREIANFLVSGSNASNGVTVDSLAYMDMHNITISAAAEGLSLLSVLSSSIKESVFVSNETGVYIAGGTSGSAHNAIEYDKCDFSLNSFRGVSGGPTNTIQISNSQIQGNGANADQTSGGIYLSFGGLTPESGLTMSNCYFEVNGGGFDLALVNIGTNKINHVLTNCQFYRADSTKYTTNNIFVSGPSRLILIGCTFGHFGSYTPNVLHQYLNVSSDVEVICIGCNFQSSVEQGSYTNAQIMDQNLIVTDNKTSGTSGGSSVTGWQNRTLNTVRYNTIPNASVSSNVVQLPSGVYRIKAKVPAYGTNQTQAALFNNNTSTFTLLGSSEYCVTNGSSVIDDVVVYTATNSFYVSMYAATAIADGLGKAASSGQGEVYTMLDVQRIATF